MKFFFGLGVGRYDVVYGGAALKQGNDKIMASFFYLKDHTDEYIKHFVSTGTERKSVK